MATEYFRVTYEDGRTLMVLSDNPAEAAIKKQAHQSERERVIIEDRRGRRGMDISPIVSIDKVDKAEIMEQRRKG